MIFGYLKIALRSILKNKLFSFINVAGLGMAMAFSLIALIQVQNVFETDNFHPFPDRTFRIITDQQQSGETLHSFASSPFLLADKLKNEYPGIEKTARVVRHFDGELDNRLKSVKVNGIYVDTSFFSIFGFPLAKGTVPAAPNTLLLTHEAAQKFFGDNEAVGQSLTHPDLGIFTVTGVLKPFKRRGTHFRSDVMVSMATYLRKTPGATGTESWNNPDIYTFALLENGTETPALQRALDDIARYHKPVMAAGKSTYSFRPQLIGDISPDVEGLERNVYVDSVKGLFSQSFIAFVILLLAGFNYVNLTLAKSIGRAREVGVRKVAGAGRVQVLIRFLTETVLLSLLSLAVAAVVFQFIRMNIHAEWMVWDVENKLMMWLIFVIFAVATGLLAGWLPAMMLSAFRPVQVLKGDLAPGTFGKAGLRKTLMVAQFVVTVVFMFFVSAMYSQFDYMATDNDNFNRKNILNLSLAGDRTTALPLNEVRRLKGVLRVGVVSSPFGGGVAGCTLSSGEDKNAAPVSAEYYAADVAFIENMKLQFVAGHNFAASRADSAGNFVILNEMAVTRLHFGTPSAAIGRSFKLNDDREVIVQGVVKDFCTSNYHELHPLVMQYDPSRFRVLSVLTQDHTDRSRFEASLKGLWAKLYPYEPIAFTWSEEALHDRFFAGDDVKFFAMICGAAFVIAIMGLLGMVTYTTERRTREIGIRKVMGAEVAEIVRLLSAGFLKLLFIALLIALPLGYVAGMSFLNVFEFHTNLDISIISFFLVAMFGLSLFTLGFRVTRAALINPAVSLKDEQ